MVRRNVSVSVYCLQRPSLLDCASSMMLASQFAHASSKTRSLTGISPIIDHHEYSSDALKSQVCFALCAWSAISFGDVLAEAEPIAPMFASPGTGSASTEHIAR